MRRRSSPTAAIALGALVIATLAPSTAARADSPFIYGIHDAEGAHLLTDGGGPGGYATTAQIVDRNNVLDYGAVDASGVTVIARLNHHWGQGTIPAFGPGEQFGSPEAWADEIAAMVARARGVRHFIIANETNLPREWPRARDGRLVPITVDQYVSLYRIVYARVKAARPDAIIMPAPVGTWAPPFNANGDITFGPDAVVPHFLDYHRQIMTRLADVTDAVAIHAYTHGADPALVGSGQTMLPPLTGVHYHFRVYRNLLGALPAALRGKAVYITECNTGVEDAPGDVHGSGKRFTWRDENRGWVQRIYDEVDAWNRANAQKIRTVCLFRYVMAPEGPWTYGIQDRPQVRADLRAALGKRQRWDVGVQPPPPPPPTGQPDVVVEAVYTDPAQPVAGEPYRILSRVRNRGGRATPAGVSVGVGYAVDGRFATWGSVIGPLAAGASVVIPHTGPAVTAPAAGDHPLLATVDDVDRFAESDETNNRRGETMRVVSATPGLPNAVIDAVWSDPARPAPGRAVRFFARVRNAGGAPTPAGIAVGVAYFVDGRYATWGVVPGPLAAGASVVVGTQGGAFAAGSPGSHGLRAVVDDIDRFAESDEADNARDAAFEVSGGIASVTGGAGPAALGSGGRTDQVTPAGDWRWSEHYWGARDIDAIAWMTDARGERHNVVFGLHAGDLVEYLLDCGGGARRLQVRAIADRPGPVPLRVWVDGAPVGTVTFGQNDDATHTEEILLPASLPRGPHAVAIELLADAYTPGAGEAGDRNMKLDGLRVVP